MVILSLARKIWHQTKNGERRRSHRHAIREFTVYNSEVCRERNLFFDQIMILERE